ncbi:MAG TPA: VOC family protein [Polyangiales bacterium]|nr:VOC family protein [Polyangiales bacterium]
MLKLDHLEISVDNYRASRDFYVRNLGFKVEFELPERRIAAVQDEFDFTLFLAEHVSAGKPRSCVLTLQVADVDATYRELCGRGVSFSQPPSRLFWGYGAELRDPNDYLLRLWDAESMRRQKAL